MVIAHNLGAMNAQRQYNIVSNRKSKTSEKLSSGYNVNRAADDAAALSISEKMRRQIRGLSQGVENTEDGVSLCQVADGALAEVHDMLQRINELSIQSANGTNSYSDRQAIQEEINQILQEIERIGDTTTFNERKLFKKAMDIESVIPEKTTTSTKDRSMLVTISGSPTETTAVNYNLSATIDGGIMLDSTQYTWDMIISAEGNSLADTKINAGTYSFNHKGISIDIKISEGQTLENVVNNINGLQINISERMKSQAKAVSSIELGNNITETVDHTTALSAVPAHTINADENGISIDNGTKVSWTSMGIDMNDIKEGTYSFNDPDSNINFKFTIENGATNDAVISGLNNVTLNMSKDRIFHYFSSSYSVTDDGCVLKTYDAMSPNQENTTSCNPNEYLGHMLGESSNYSSYFVFKTDSVGDLYLEYHGSSLNGTVDSRHNFYLTDESLRLMKYGFDYSLPSEEQTFTQITGGRKIEFKSQKGSSIYMYIENDGTGSYDNLVSDFDGRHFVAFSGGDVQVRYRATSADTNSIADGNVGATTYETYIAEDDKTLLAHKDTYTETITTPSTIINIRENVGNIWIQSGCESGDGMWLEIDPMNTSILGIDGIDVTTELGANDAIEKIDGALEKVSSNRAKIGAQQNRLEHTIANENNIVENTTAAESRIRDADMAELMVQFSKENILAQVGQSMMAQSNQSNQGVLSLLQ